MSIRYVATIFATLVGVAMIVTGIALLASAKRCLPELCSPEELASRTRSIQTGAVLLTLGVAAVVTTTVVFALTRSVDRQDDRFVPRFQMRNEATGEMEDMIVNKEPNAPVNQTRYTIRSADSSPLSSNGLPMGANKLSSPQETGGATRPDETASLVRIRPLQTTVHFYYYKIGDLLRLLASGYANPNALNNQMEQCLYLCAVEALNKKTSLQFAKTYNQPQTFHLREHNVASRGVVKFEPSMGQRIEQTTGITFRDAGDSYMFTWCDSEENCDQYHDFFGQDLDRRQVRHVLRAFSQNSIHSRLDDDVHSPPTTDDEYNRWLSWVFYKCGQRAIGRDRRVWLNWINYTYEPDKLIRGSIMVLKPGHIDAVSRIFSDCGLNVRTNYSTKVTITWASEYTRTSSRHVPVQVYNDDVLPVLSQGDCINDMEIELDPYSAFEPDPIPDIPFKISDQKHPGRALCGDPVSLATLIVGHGTTMFDLRDKYKELTQREPPKRLISNGEMKALINELEVVSRANPTRRDLTQLLEKLNEMLYKELNSSYPSSAYMERLGLLGQFFVNMGPVWEAALKYHVRDPETNEIAVEWPENFVKDFFDNAWRITVDPRHDEPLGYERGPERVALVAKIDDLKSFIFDIIYNEYLDLSLAEVNKIESTYGLNRAHLTSCKDKNHCMRLLGREFISVNNRWAFDTGAPLYTYDDLFRSNRTKYPAPERELNIERQPERQPERHQNLPDMPDLVSIVGPNQESIETNSSIVVVRNVRMYLTDHSDDDRVVWSYDDVQAQVESHPAYCRVPVRDDMSPSEIWSATSNCFQALPDDVGAIVRSKHPSDGMATLKDVCCTIVKRNTNRFMVYYFRNRGWFISSIVPMPFYPHLWNERGNPLVDRNHPSFFSFDDLYRYVLTLPYKSTWTTSPTLGSFDRSNKVYVYEFEYTGQQNEGEMPSLRDRNEWCDINGPGSAVRCFEAKPDLEVVIRYSQSLNGVVMLRKSQVHYPRKVTYIPIINGWTFENYAMVGEQRRTIKTHYPIFKTLDSLIEYFKNDLPVVT